MLAKARCTTANTRLQPAVQPALGFASFASGLLDTPALLRWGRGMAWQARGVVQAAQITAWIVCTLVSQVRDDQRSLWDAWSLQRQRQACSHDTLIGAQHTCSECCAGAWV